MVSVTKEYVGSHELRILTEEEKRNTPPYMLEYINYRKTGLSLNHIIGCPLNCGYCVRHFWGNFDDKSPHLICSDDEAIESLLNHKYFIPHKTPLQLFNKATDPFLPSVKPHTFYILKRLDDMGLTNIITVITRFKVEEEDMRFLEQLKNINVVLFFTYSGIKDTRIEPIAASGITLKSIETASRYKNRTKIILYWRPIVQGWNDDDETMKGVLKVSELCDAIVFTGYYHREENVAYLNSLGVEVNYKEFQRRKILPDAIDKKVVKLHREMGVKTPLFRKTSCGTTYVLGLPDYNGHWGVQELCDICPEEQKKRCATAHRRPSEEEFAALLKKMDFDTPFLMEDGHIWTSNLGEDRRYFLQHHYSYQIWDIKLPHFKDQHGRGKIGYSTPLSELEQYEKTKQKFMAQVISED